MQLFFELLLIFACGSMVGWITEVFFRRFVSSKMWINPGFLTGPVLPIYGFGIAALYILSDAIKLDINFNLPWYINDIIVILSMGLIMTLIELFAGLIFIKGMNIKLWDYSDRKFNFKGIICPTFSLIWTIVGCLFYYLIYPFLTKGLDKIDFTIPLIPLFLGIFYGIMIIDLCISLNLSLKIRTFAKDHQVIIRFEKFKESIACFEKEAKRKISFILPFKSKNNLKDNLEKHINRIKSLRENKKEK